MPEGGQEDKIIAYLNDLASNRYRFMNPSPFRKNHRYLTSRIIFKIHELEHLVDQIEARCKGQVMGLIRHPIATTISRRVFPRLELFVKSPFYRHSILTYEQCREVDHIWARGSSFEKGIMSWAYENLLLLRSSGKRGRLLISYEEALLNTVKTCTLLHEKLGLPNLGRLIAAVGMPSTNIAMSGEDTLRILSTDDDTVRRHRLVTKWRGKVTQTQEESAHNILAIFGIDAYVRDRFVPTERYLNFSDTPIPHV